MFQLITDTYGVPSYQEANPSPINIVTFPFLFGMMFGDMGHGSLYLFAGIYLTLFNESLKKTSMGKIFSPFRYMILLMGLCSTYCGFIYNEFFALPLNLFSSCYELDHRTPWVPSQAGVTTFEYTYLRKSYDCNYPMGFDPVWSLSSNKLILSNNIKMKISVIVGVIHMSMGIFIKGTNSIYFGRMADLFTEVVTGLVILIGLFGWMDLLVFAKWFITINVQDTTPVVVDGVTFYQGDI